MKRFVILFLLSVVWLVQIGLIAAAIYAGTMTKADKDQMANLANECVLGAFSWLVLATVWISHVALEQFKDFPSRSEPASPPR